MNKKDFYYDLPEELIANEPLNPRDTSRMLVINRKTGEIEHKHFYDLVDYVQKGDLFVINNTRVIPARIYGTKVGHSAKCEILLQKRIDLKTWEVVIKPAKRFKIGTQIEFSKDLTGTVIKDSTEGCKYIEFAYDGVFEDILHKIGETPLPHYIKKPIDDSEKYQTVYNKIPGSSAAPTAGFHFTNELMKKIEEKGAEFVEVLLHVGLGTFRPVKDDDILKHKMHSEYFEVSKEAAEKINKAKREGRRVIAVGTTSVRTLEASSNDEGVLIPQKGETNIFIYPGYKFKMVDALITNFHLPESTLIMLVSAFAGHENTMNFYKVAVEEKYRFFSFGDACFIK